jgi:UDP-N-acetylglucosamine 4-epimerase
MEHKYGILITGGAGFIGSNLVEKYMNDPRISLVRVIDDLSNGYFSNIEKFINDPKFEFVKGDICDYELCLKVTSGIDKISHQAALGSVPRSISNPMRSTEVNILGTVNILNAAKENKVERIILACSSSTYGDSKDLPKKENVIGKPLSPYGVTKYSIELFADVFHQVYGLNYIGLRYFNVFGPKQAPNNAYAAVIPKFCKAVIEGKNPEIYGDGETSRDFTYIENVLLANDLALFSTNRLALNQIYNIACGEQTTLNQIIENLRNISGKKIDVIYKETRPGDVRHSKADINKIRELLGYEPVLFFKQGLETVYNWYKNNNQ